jgi:phospholipid transport system transporter-binding protein
MNGAWIVPRGYGRISVEGVLDFETVAPLLAESQRRFVGKERLDIDLQGVRNANSAGLALLLEWVGLAHQNGVSLRLRNPPAPLMRLAAVTNVVDLLPVVRGGA